MRLRIAQKLTLALAALLLLTMAVAWVGIASLANLNARTRALYGDNLVTTEATTSLGASLDDTKAAALQLLLTSDAAGRSQLHERLQGTIVPAVEGGIATLRQLHATGPVVERDRVEQIAAGWADFRYLLDSGPLTPHDPAELQGAARRVAAILEPITTLAVKLAAIETQQGREAAERAAATYHTARSHILALTVGAALGWLVIAVTLVRNIVPRVQSYSRFAARVANGDLCAAAGLRGLWDAPGRGHLPAAAGQRRGDRCWSTTPSHPQKRSGSASASP